MKKTKVALAAQACLAAALIRVGTLFGAETAAMPADDMVETGGRREIDYRGDAVVGTVGLGGSLE